MKRNTKNHPRSEQTCPGLQLSSRPKLWHLFWILVYVRVDGVFPALERTELRRYRDFLIAYEDAQNTAERVLTSKLLAAANKEPRVLMWILERRFPGNWRLQQHQAFSGSAGQLLELRVSKERETRDSHSSYPIG